MQEIQELRKERVRINFEENLLPVFDGCEATLDNLNETSSFILKFRFESLGDKELSEFKDFIESNDNTRSGSEIFLDTGSIRLFYYDRGDRKHDHVSVTVKTDDFKSLKKILGDKFASVEFSNVDEKIEGKSGSITSKVDSIKKVEKERRKLEELKEQNLLL